MHIHMYNVCIRSTDFRFGVTGTKCRRGFRTSCLTPLFNVLIVWGWPIKISPKMSQIPKPKHIALFPSTCTNVHTFRINNPKKKKKSVAAAKNHRPTTHAHKKTLPIYCARRSLAYIPTTNYQVHSTLLAGFRIAQNNRKSRQSTIYLFTTGTHTHLLPVSCPGSRRLFKCRISNWIFPLRAA